MFDEEVEIWREIPFAPRYLASSFGRIVGLRKTLLHPSLGHRDYLVCDLHKKQYRVNRIICWTFHGESPTKEHHAAHKDSDSSNNYASNLYWATALENARDLSATGKNKGQNSFAAQLKDEEVLRIRKLHNEGARIVDIAKEFHPRVRYAAISSIIHRHSWRHL